MKRSITFSCVVLFVTAPLALFGVQTIPVPDLEKLKAKPIAVGGGKVGELLRQWWKEGTAAGNGGDFYDNRDGDHSPLNLAPYPQLSAIKYSEDDIKLRKHWAAARLVLPHVTFGNSSTSAPAHLGGSNPRSYYVSPLGMSILYNQYTRNNLYIYPEHRDHDPGHNGRYFAPGKSSAEEGYGDMYPTNTPYLLISQGSSGSDQPFMRMLPSALAAFRPEVKKKLTEAGLLMPTLQMLLRSTNKHLKDPKEYLTGKAHPSVFEGSWVDDLAIVQKAHALELKALPPMVQLRVLEEDKAVAGVDYFDPVTEVLAYTPVCIARVHRGKAQKQRIVVSADGSYDLNKSKLTYTWVILRGDPDKIKIVPTKDDHSAAEITVLYHDRRPVSPGSALESNRVDIGVFVHNGTHYSAPGFITFHTLDREARTYNPRGLPLDIAHGMGETDLRVTSWEKLFAHLGKEQALAEMLQISEDQQNACRVQAALHQILNVRISQAQEAIKAAEAKNKVAKEEADKVEAKKTLDAAQKSLVKIQQEAKDHLDAKNPAFADSPRQFVESRIAKVTRDPLFTLNQAGWLKKNRTAALEPRVKALWQKMFRFGIAGDKENLTPLLPGKTLADSQWTAFERSQLEWLHASLLAELGLPGMVQVSYRVNYVDHRLSIPREWRDVYRYDPKGEFIGWRRYSAEGNHAFNHEGLLIVEADPRGCCVKGRTVRYVQEPSKTKGFINTNLLRAVPGDTIVHYEFADKDDWRGRRTGTETVKDEKK